MSPALRALLAGAIDYAGMFPPAGLGREVAIANYRRYRADKHAWALGRFVIAAAAVDGVRDVPLAILSDADDARAEVLESKRTVTNPQRVTYCEGGLEQLDAIQASGCFAKLRTGGVTPDAIPSIDAVAEFIHACVRRRLPFKATAGLHHAIRAEHPLSYQPDAPISMMHGFVNVFAAAAFAWAGEKDVRPILADEDPAAFRFGDDLQCRDLSLSHAAIGDARKNFIHSFGSCSFEEPIQDLERLRWL